MVASESCERTVSQPEKKKKRRIRMKDKKMKRKAENQTDPKNEAEDKE